MSKLRVDEIQSRTVNTQTTQEVALKRRRELHATSGFDSERATFAGIGRQDLSALKSGAGETAASVATAEFALPSGRTVSFSTVSSGWSDELAAFRAKLSDGEMAVLTRHAEALATAALEATPEEAAKASEELPERVVAALQDSAELTAQGAAINAYPATQMVTGESLLIVEQQLRDVLQNIAAREEFGTEAKATVLDLQEMLDDWPDDGSEQLFSYRELKVDDEGNYSIDEHKNVSLTKEEAEALLEKMQQQAEAAGSMTTMETFQIEQLTQKYRQASEILSAIVDLTHKELSAIIGNVRA